MPDVIYYRNVYCTLMLFPVAHQLMYLPAKLQNNIEYFSYAFLYKYKVIEFSIFTNLKYKLCCMVMS